MRDCMCREDDAPDSGIREFVPLVSMALPKLKSGDRTDFGKFEMTYVLAALAAGLLFEFFRLFPFFYFFDFDEFLR